MSPVSRRVIFSLFNFERIFYLSFAIIDYVSVCRKGGCVTSWHKYFISEIYFSYYSEGLGFEFVRVLEVFIFTVFGEILVFVMLIPSIGFLVEIMVSLLKNRWCVCMAVKAFSLMVLSCSLLASVCVCLCVCVWILNLT